MIKDGIRVPPSEFCSPTRIGSSTLDDVADLHKVLDLYRRGATVVLQSLHRTWAPLSSWCAALEREVGWPVQANAYLTPPGERGLAAHADGHDVIAVQLHGNKQWHLHGHGQFELEAGNVLYVPAGVEHCARTDTRPSLHLTVGIHRPTPARVARAAATAAIERAGFPADTTPDGSIWLLNDMLRDVDGDAVVARLRRRPRAHAGGLLARSVVRPEITHATRIAPILPWTVESIGDRVALEWPNGRLNLPDRARVAAEMLARDGGPVSVGRLPGLDPSEQTVLARRLLDEGAAELSG